MNTNNDTVALLWAPGEYSITAVAENYLGCTSQTSNPLNVVVEAQAAAPQINSTNVLVEELTAEWQGSPEILGFELSLDSGQTWINPNGTNSYTVDGLSFKTEVAFWLRRKTEGVCNYTSIETKVCKTQNCFDVTYDLVNDSVCTSQEEGIVEFNNLNLDKYSISFNGQAYSSNWTFKYNVVDFNLGQNIVKVSFIDSNALSCPAFDITITVAVNQAPTPEVLNQWSKINDENRICLNDNPKTLEGTASEGGMGYTNMQCLGNGVGLVSESQFEFNPNTAGAGAHVLEYAVTNNYGCTSSAFDTVMVDSAKVASFNFSTEQRLLTFASAVEGATEVIWDFGDGNTSDELNPTYYYNTDGTYTVTLETNDASNICADVSASEEVAVIGGSISEKSIQVEAFPNPFNETFCLKFYEEGNYEIEMLSANGAVVYNSTTNATNFSINTSNLTEGVYLLRISNQNRVYKSIIVKQDILKPNSTIVLTALKVSTIRSPRH